MKNLITKEFIEKFWSLSKSHVMGKTRRWRNQRIYFKLPEDMRPLIEGVTKKKLPEVVIVNAIFTGIFMKSLGGAWSKKFYCVMLRDVLYQWSENEALQTFMFSSRRKTNKRRAETWDFLTIYNRLVKLKQMKVRSEIS